MLRRFSSIGAVSYMEYNCCGFRVCRSAHCDPSAISIPGTDIWCVPYGFTTVYTAVIVRVPVRHQVGNEA